jgi:hypothetical protein
MQSILFAQNSNKATVKFVIGNVELQKNNQISWIKLGLKNNLYEGDRIKTAANSRVELNIPDGSVLKINENTVFDIKELKTPEFDGEDKMSFTLWSGKLWAGFKKIFSDRQERVIKSPSAVVAIRGTTIEMEVDIRQKTTVRVIEGSVSVKSKDIEGEVIITSNQETIVEKGKAPTNPEYFKPDNGKQTEEFPFRINLRKFVFTDPAVLAAGIPVSGNIPAGTKLFANGIVVPVTATGSFNTRLRVVEGVNEINLQAKKEEKSVSRTLKVYVNTKKPDIRLSSPLVSGFYNRRDYSLSGGVFDQTPNDKVKITLNGEEITVVEGMGSFNRTIILKEGSNKISVIATDRSGNSKEYVQEIFLDTVKPILTVTEPAAISFVRFEPPPPPSVTDHRVEQTIRGIVIDPEPSSGIKRISLNGKEIKPNSDGSFEASITIKRGLNNLNFVVEDLAGNIFRDNTRKIRIPR